MQETVLYETNRIDLFCLEHLGSADDATRRRFIRWNYDHFVESPTFWLPLGETFYISSPPMIVAPSFADDTGTPAPPTLSAPSYADDTGTPQAWTQSVAISGITVPAASGNPTPTYAPVGNLPAGITFNASTRLILGTPTAIGSGTITIRATNSEGSDDWTVDYTTSAAGALSTNEVILDSLADLQAAFDNVVVGSDGGRWRQTSSGSTVSGNTGPGSNNILGFVYTETSGSDEIDVIASRGIVDMQSDEIPDGINRVLHLRLAIAGDYADGTEGLEILTRVDDSGTWVQAGFIYGWAFSDTYEQGDTFDDENDVERTVAADGGWVDFEVSIPDTAGQIQFRPHYIHGEDTQRWEHDIAFRSFSFDYDTV